MIPAEYYQAIYLFIVTIFTLYCFARYNRYDGEIYENRYITLILAICLVLFIGFRPIHAVFADTVGYAEYYNYKSSDIFSLSFDVENKIFDNLLLWMSSHGFGHSAFFVSIALIYFVCRYVSCKKMFPNNSLIAYLVFLGAFLTFVSSVNGIKAGAAASIFTCAIAYRHNKLLSLLLLLLSWGFHHSMIVCVLAFILVTFYKNTKWYSILWVFSFIIAALHISYFQNLFVNFTNEKGAAYLIAEDGWITGMRYDFVLYSAIPILLGWWYKIKYDIMDEEYDFVLNLYILLNALWMLCMYASFTNRIAALSWFLYPLVLIYPFLSAKIELPNKNYKFSWVILGHLCFTLFMQIVYYS